MSGPEGQYLQRWAGVPAGSLGSEAMEATPALDPTSRTHEPASLTDALEHESTDVDQISIGQRLTQPRTILSIAVPLAIEPPFASLPPGPGLGVQLDRDAVRNYQTDVREYRE